ncbi:uncharacterized protein LOC101461783 isoform X2 [Ceratitis capitata]|uniref:(Mediterranean fruit fly) hypothetical protein n=2 Tax=Ceratitis capitata TaxID=7213 RepID=W8C3K6_CERCA|nr:uncharacterized protein LOC101461783 isoform X2 [Ceratitis capitata]XP_012159650.1 uncharacterized protein LOC101461783 isoform X2 [Ceratitis capitata]XP_020716477.1 uncharacterized protein LOC101461783 isoform X2 [Ceratitis capitata]XP_020716480.1 uncharacterized protein LOC101461783 isoform X2 [Ceratitis capitata]CAD7005072.1 unnamed protein product [Ceratitis capitata]
MHEAATEEFDLLGGASSIYEKGMCLAVHQINLQASIHPGTPVDHQLVRSPENVDNNYINAAAPTNLLSDIKTEVAASKDLFPTQSSTWQQHPINSEQHAHHRYQHRHQQRLEDRHQHRLSLSTSKLLLQNSDDPLISHGANNVVTADDDNQLIISLSPNEDNSKSNRTDRTFGSHSISSTANIQSFLSISTSAQQPKKMKQNGCSPLTKQQLKVKASLMSAQNRAANELKRSGQQPASVVQSNKKTTDSRKGVLKLRFHHQALPAEYLSHYEATQGYFKPKFLDTSSVKSMHTPKLPPVKTSHENVRSWLQKIAAIHRSAQRSESNPNTSVKIVDQHRTNTKLLKHETSTDTNNNYQMNRVQFSEHSFNSQKSADSLPRDNRFDINTIVKQSPSSSSASLNTTTIAPNYLKSKKKSFTFTDLPYMGEITLDNSRPRRGRKPKKADICHLIYKNYGTIFPETPKNVQPTADVIKGTIQNEENLRITDELPLNLCMRDQQCDHYSISSEDSQNASGLANVSLLNDELIERIATPKSNDERPSQSKLRNELPISNNRKPSVILKVESSIGKARSTSTTSSLNTNTPKISNNNKPNDIVLHPLNLYYHQLLSNSLLNRQNQPFGLPIETIEKDNQLTLKIPIPNGLLRIPKSEKITSNLSISSQTIDYPDNISTPSSFKSESSNTTTRTTMSAKTPTATVNATGQQIITPQKRKRSAIFIPPIPTEYTSNPATEVSICKFKFTGGVKPSLQEKKMLSVDSGGNFRYYSGTGDKSTRGYEFFPRKSLQNAAGFLPGVSCSISCANNENEYSTSDIPPPSAELSNEILQIPESPTATLLLPPTVSLPKPSSPSPLTRSPDSYSSSPALPIQQQTSNIQIIVDSKCDNALSVKSISSTKNQFINSVAEVEVLTPCNPTQRKKKAGKSSQREKLEKTFKEKGFLIQTQQLESAEGATYCKFRQLKRFTRYLFRNWKDYLPEEVYQENTSVGTVVIHQPNIEEEVKKESDITDCLTEQLAIESILERHGFLETGNLCPKSSKQTLLSTQNLVET